MEGSDDYRYLYVGPEWVSWAIWSSLTGEEIFIDSGSCGQACPAHPRNAHNSREGSRDWKFNREDDNDVDSEDWGEGGVVIHCSVHNN